MNRRVLLVDDSPSLLATMTDALEGSYDVHTASTGEEALAKCEHDGPFAAIITDYEMPVMNGIELLSRLEQGWPNTTRMMLTGFADLELAVEAMRSGSIFRFLSKTSHLDDLRNDIQAGVERFWRVEEERLFTEQLQFSRESLLSLTETLERRLATQLGRLHGMHRFAAQLNKTRSVQEVAELSAETTSRLLHGRPVEVTLEGVGESDVFVVRGGELPAEVHVAPVATSEACIGSIRVGVGPAGGSQLNRAERDFVTSIAASTAVAAHSQMNRHERDSAQHATIFALARLAEYRDDETGKHLERVTKYCDLIGRGLREDGKHVSILTDGYLRDLWLSAPLHDIGKVGVPDSILLKPGKLTEDEWVIMRKHTTIGAETLRNVLESSGEQSFLRMGHEIAWCHHERWGGGGYPRNLEGDEIPLSARIMALADCYDALTSRRPYKEPWSHAEAMNYIREQDGQHFDPDIVAVFTKREREFGEICRLLTDNPGDGPVMIDVA